MNLEFLGHTSQISGSVRSQIIFIVFTFSLLTIPINSNYTFWSSDFHISPIADLKHLFSIIPETKNIKIIDKSLSGHCHIFNTCQQDLKVLNKDNGINLSPCNNQLREQFYNAYKNDPQMKKVDAFLCHHADSMCEIFMAFGRPLFVITSTRYEIGRYNSKHWKRWNANLRLIAADSHNTVGANNVYDAEYMKHFTGIKYVEILPNFCGYADAKYNPRNPTLLIGPSHLNIPGSQLAKDLKEAAREYKNGKIQIKKIRELYPHYQFSDLARHKAIVLIPYQISVMTFFEYYRMGIPIFAPTRSLLVELQTGMTLLKELSWNCVFNKCREKSAIPASGDSPHEYDPNDIYNKAGMDHWLQYADFYQIPHILLYDNWNDLLRQVEETDFDEVSSKMQIENARLLSELRIKWLGAMARAFPKEEERTKEVFPTWKEAMRHYYPDANDIDSRC